jgi:hypothetical protein
VKQDDKEKDPKEKKEKKDKGDGVVTIQAALPDLKFGSVVVIPAGDVAGGSGATGQAATITVTITKAGWGSAGEFRLDVWKHRPFPPNFGSIGDFSQTFDSLAGNTSLTVSYSFTMANSYGRYFPRSTVDSGSLVGETSEANNTHTGSDTVIEMATVMPPTINTVAGSSVVFRGVAKNYGKKWPVNQPSALITVPGVGTVTVPHDGTATLAGVGTFGPIVKNLIGDASLTCALAQSFIGTATVTFICGTSTASGQLRSVFLRAVSPAATTIGTGSSLTFTAGQTILQSPPREIAARQLGNHWKVVTGFSQQQVVTDTVLNAGTANGQNNVLSYLRNGAPLAAKYQSPLLSVWRTLHVEVDSMAAVADNKVQGVIREIGAGTNVATVTVTFSTLADGSMNLPTANGRFENGTITVGPRSSSLTGNGNDFFQGAAGGGVIRVPFTMVDANGVSFVAGTITQMVITGGGLQSLMQLSTTTLTMGAYNGGTIIVGGGTPASIVSNGASTVLKVGLVDAPYRVHDDDDDSLLPKYPDFAPRTGQRIRSISKPAN